MTTIEQIIWEIIFQYLPADMHSHLRDGLLMETMVANSAWRVGYECVEPNTSEPIVTTRDAIQYKKKILAAAGGMWPTYSPLIGVYLTARSDPDDIAAGYRDGEIGFIKSYPPHGTTGSHLAVPVFSRYYNTIADMAEREGVPLQHHGELTHNATGDELDEQDRETAFYEKVFPEIRRRWPEMRYFGEHLTTAEGVEAILNDPGCCGTITPWHLLTDRRIRDRGGCNPLYAVKPALKREKHMLALRKAVSRRCPRLFAGTDRAAHPRKKKSSPVGCACGIYSPYFIEWYAAAFEVMGLLDYLEEFLCLNGPRAYGLEPIRVQTRLLRMERPRYERLIRFGLGRNDVVVPFGYHHNPKAPPDLRLPNHWHFERTM